MKLFFIVVCAAVSVSALEDWAQYTQKYQKFYTEYEEKERIKAFQQSVKIVNEINDKFAKKELSFKASLNKYADEPRSETSSNLLGLRPPSSKNKDKFFKNVDPNKNEMRGAKPPPYMNWAEKNATNPVQDQGSCGSCYAFTTVGVIESHMKIKHKQLYKLSEQQVVDCTDEYGNYGCDGGLMTAAYDYFIENDKGVMKNDDYEYMSFQQSQCYDEDDKHVVLLDRYRALPPENEDLMINSLAHVGPLAAAMDASQPSFLFYKEGIYDDPKCNSSVDAMNHAVMIVGYGSKAGKDYWIIKNTWSDDWGVNGFGYILRNDENFAGLANLVSYPVVRPAKKLAKQNKRG